jgi:hypothetical protein
VTEHETSIERLDDTSRYGRPRRSYRAVCSCGWRHEWSTPIRHMAESDAELHRARAGAA